MNSLLIKVVVAILFVAGTVMYADHVKHGYIQQGRDEATKDFEEKMQTLRLQHIADMKQMQIGFEKNNGKVVEEYEDRLKYQADSYEIRIAGIRSSGGLRIPKADIGSNERQPETASAEANHEAGDYRLPERIENDLFAFARKADEVKEQLNACQSWIKTQGFYTENQR